MISNFFIDRPLFALVVILTTAIAIGANGAVYGLLASIVLRPLPVAQPASLSQC